MRITILYPPFTDMTQPYHGPAYLMGQLKANGFSDTHFLDLNAELFHQLCHPDSVAFVNDELERLFKQLSSLNSLTFAQQEQYFGLAAASRLDPDAVRRATDRLRSRSAFLNYESYLESVRTIAAYSQALSALSYPEALWGHSIGPGRFWAHTLADLLHPDLATSTCYLVDQFLRERLLRDDIVRSSGIVGICLQYDEQLLAGIHLARLLKAANLPQTVVFGGAAITQIFKYLRQPLLAKELFRLCDAIVLGEGESAISQIAQAGGDVTLCSTIPNTLTYDRRSDRLHIPEVMHYEDLNSLAQPVYDYEWALYLSPERGVCYSPTRGCYWNRCAFCDYGLSAGAPTSPWRERDVDKVVSDLVGLTDQGVHFVYFAVDAMRPIYLERLCSAMISARINVRWAAEIRMEAAFSLQLCRQMAASGCIAVSLGMESGSERLLKVMNKGTTVAGMDEVLKHLSAANIAAQLMLFTNFPGETAADRDMTRDFITAHRQYWSSGAIGRFVLTARSLVAQDPNRFNIDLVVASGDDVVRTTSFRPRLPDAETETYLAAPSISQDIFPRVHKRPWAGGVDTLHSMIYYDSYGPEVFKARPLPQMDVTAWREDLLDEAIEVRGELRVMRFHPAEILRNRKTYRQQLAKDIEAGRNSSYSKFLDWQGDIPALSTSRDVTYWLTNGRTWHRLDRTVHSVLRSIQKREVVPRSIVAELPAHEQEAVIAVMARLASRGVIGPRRLDSVESGVRPTGSL